MAVDFHFLNDPLYRLMRSNETVLFRFRCESRVFLPVRFLTR
jgi:hypothetical protein